MKTTRKLKTSSALLALVVSLYMLLSIGFTAFADNDSSGNLGSESRQTYSITIANPTVGETYSAYKIFDVTYNLVEVTDEDEKGAEVAGSNYSYTISSTSSWYDVITMGVKKNEIEGLTLEEIESVNENVEEYLVTFDSGYFSAAGFAKYLAGNVESINEDGCVTYKEKSDNGCEIELKEAGYYLVVCTEVHDKDENGNTKVALAELTTTDPNVTINDKNNVTIDKKQSLDKDGTNGEGDSTYTDSTKSVSVGDTVYFQITGKVPDTTGFDTYTYTISDTLSKGLTLSDDDKDKVPDVTVKIDGEEISKCSCDNCGCNDCGIENGCVDGCTVYYTLTPTENEDKEINGFEIKFYFKNSTFEVGSEIEITYSAKVNESAISGTQTNSATLTYSNDPTDSSSTDTSTDTTTVYTCEIKVYKFSGYEKCVDLKEFEKGTTYYTCDENTGIYTKANKFENDKVYYIGTPLAGATFVLYRLDNDKNVEYYKWNIDDEGVIWVKTVNEATALTTNSEGTLTLNENEIDFFGLEDGTYYLLETAAPEGYNMLTDAIKVEVEVAGQSEDEDGNLVEESYVYTKDVENLAGSKLPETGGMGTVIFYIVGSVLALSAGVLLIVRLRISKRENAAA